MAARERPLLEITPQVLLKAYACGIFPMAESADDPQLYWIEPQARGVLPLDGVTVPSRLRRTIRQQPYDVSVDIDFEGVISGCAASRPGRRSTWINNRIRSLYRELHRLALGGAFFGESMFSEVRDASKVALVYLCARLIEGGFVMLDTQFVTDHLRQFGTIEVEKGEFHRHLERALKVEGDFFRLDRDPTPARVLEIVLGASGAR